MRDFFGLSEIYMESVFEQLFVLKHYGHWSFAEAYCLPVGLRIWFLNRLKKEVELQAAAYSE